MGYYLQVPPVFDKATYLVNHHGAELIFDPAYVDPASGKLAVCVVANPAFEAAGIVYSPQELAAFSQPTDVRFKTWLRVPVTEVLKLCPMVANVLPLNVLPLSQSYPLA